MANTSGYTGDTDFLKWYKSHYGKDYDENTGLVRKSGMSDGDWNVGTVLQNYYIKNNQNEQQRTEGIGDINTRYDEIRDTAIDGYDLARKRLGAGKSAAQQNAAITYQKLQKYLPMRQKAQGLGGLGTESAGIDAYNKYMSQMGGIESDYQSNMTAIDENQTSHLGEIEIARAESIEEKNALHDTIARGYASDADSDSRDAWDNYLKGVKDEQKAAYDMAMEILKTSTATDPAELMQYVSQLKGKTSAEQYAALERYAANVAAANSKTKTEADNAAAAEIAETAIIGMLDSGDYKGAQDLLEKNKNLLGQKSVEIYQDIIDRNNQVEVDDRVLAKEESLLYNGERYKLGGKLMRDAIYKLWDNGTLKKGGLGDKYSSPYDTKIPNGTVFGTWDGKAGLIYYNGEWYQAAPVNSK